MWSLGCVLYEMAALRPPFTATDLPGLYKKICAGQFSRIPANYSN
jgi:serine/threonine protein kinase